MRAPEAVPDAFEILAIHKERAEGLSPNQIGARHEISGVVVQQFLRPRTNTTLPTPFELTRTPQGQLPPIPMYWLGFIAASGRAANRTSGRPLVLSVDTRDEEHVRTMVRDLLRVPAAHEFCYSSHGGHQAYIRERDLGEAVTHWGLTTDPREGVLPVDHIPAAALPHFVRGLIEGQVHHPPFGGRGPAAAHPSPRVRRVVLAGSPGFLQALQRRIRESAAGAVGTMSATGSPAAALLTFSGLNATALLRYAYRNSVRFAPRADRLVKAFGTTPSA